MVKRFCSKNQKKKPPKRVEKQCEKHRHTDCRFTDSDQLNVFLELLSFDHMNAELSADRTFLP